MNPLALLVVKKQRILSYINKKANDFLNSHLGRKSSTDDERDKKSVRITFAI